MRIRFALAAWLICSCRLIAATFPTTLPHGLGVNIHFTDPKKGEMEQLAAAGFKLVRMDFDWIGTEKERGKYDWSQYETLLAALKPHGIKPIFILDYANPLYDDNRSPDTDEGRKAFATWAAAAAAHFHERGILWEMYNEPNIHPFWRPKPNPADYVKLALEVGKALRQAAPNEAFIGPACSGIDLPFLETCFKAGLLEYFSGISVHPYRQHPPETVADDYRKLRLLIERHAPRGKSIPIYSGEWGYSSSWSAMDEQKHGLYLPRQWLTNICNDVPVSIWYDWHDDGPDPKEPEHHFGTVHLDYTPKPAYLAAKKLTDELAGFTFNKRLWLVRDDEYVLVFARGEDVKLAAWTSGEVRRVDVPGVIGATLTSEVQYLTPAKSPLLSKLVEWKRAPLDRIVKAPIEVEGNEITRGQESFALEVPFKNAPVKQRTVIVVANPLKLSLRRDRDGGLAAAVDNPSGEPFFGVVRLVGTKSMRNVLRLAAGETSATAPLPLILQGDPRAAVELTDDRGAVVARSSRYDLVSVLIAPDFFDVRAEGDKDVKSTQSVSVLSPRMMEVTYSFEPGWKYVCLHPKSIASRIDGKPKALGLWVMGDASGNVPRLRFVDDTGQTFQPDGPRMTWTDYRYLSFPLDGKQGGHWGGANDGVVHYPIRLETLLLIDSADRGKTSGTVKVESPTLVYEEVIP